MSRLQSIFAQPAFGHLTTLKRHSDWCFLNKYKNKNKTDNEHYPDKFNDVISVFSTVLFICLCIQADLH